LNFKGVVIVAGIGILLLSIWMLQSNTKNTHPIIDDTPAVGDNVLTDISPGIQDTMTVNDSAEVNKDLDFLTDENGTKHYTINATDMPALG
jgi:hypothetical protein